MINQKNYLREQPSGRIDLMTNLNNEGTTMEIWQYLEVLRRPNKTWFFSKDTTEEKIDALSKIAIDGYPGLISCLTEFLKDSNKEVREATCSTIIHLFKKIESKRGYYDSLRHCIISKGDLDFYEANFTKEQFVELLAISSLNGNGFVREKAVIKLAQVENPRAIPFLIFRLADWVLPVQQSALRGIENYKSAKYIDNLISNLPIFEWLKNVERTDLSGVFQNIIEFIASTNRDYVLSNFRKYPDKLRFTLSKHISISLSDNSMELKLFLTDKLFLIRNLAIDHFDKLSQNEVNHLLNDKSAKVRLQTLYRVKGQNNFLNIAKDYLADDSATIRYFARFTLKQANINFADFYYQNLMQGKQVVGSLIGLAEVDAKQYSEKIKEYLIDRKIKYRKSAFLALRKLDKEGAYDFALANIDTSFVGLRNILIDFLSVVPRPELLTKARYIYKIGNQDLKKSMLKLFNKIGSWTAIADLMLGTVDENENIRQLAFEYLSIWKSRAVRLFSTPGQEEIERAKQIFNFAHEMHEGKQYFKTNPLEGLDFYFN